MIASSALLQNFSEMWTTLQQLVQRGLHMCNNIVCFQNVCFLRNYILIWEMCVEPVYGWEPNWNVRHVYTVRKGSYLSKWIDWRWMWDEKDYTKPNLRGSAVDAHTHTLHLQERSKLQLPTIGASTCWNSSKQYTHKKSVGQPSLAARWCWIISLRNWSILRSLRTWFWGKPRRNKWLYTQRRR